MCGTVIRIRFHSWKHMLLMKINCKMNWFLGWNLTWMCSCQVLWDSLIWIFINGEFFFHLNLMGAEAVFKVSWPIAGEHNCTNWHVSFYNMTTKCTFAYTAVQRKHYKFSQNKDLLWQVGLTHIQLQFAFEGQYNSLALHFLH